MEELKDLFLIYLEKDNFTKEDVNKEVLKFYNHLKMKEVNNRN